MRERNAAGVALAALCLGLYWLTGYGGVRSPDCEVVFRTAESLALRGTWAIQPLEDWPQFGTAVGTDGRRYSKFGPLPSVVLAPAVWMGKALERAGGVERVGGLVPLSHFAGGGLRHLRQGSRPADLRPHFLRFAASWVNPLLAALGVFAFWRLARRLSSSPGQAWRAALLYAFATPLWAYAGTFFSEPLAILFILLALERLTALDRSIALEERPATGAACLAAGLLGGAACLSHLTAALFLPPLLVYAFFGGRDGVAGWKEEGGPGPLSREGPGSCWPSWARSTGCGSGAPSWAGAPPPSGTSSGPGRPGSGRTSTAS